LSLLKEIGVEPKLPKNIDAPGLSCALGGLGLTLEQLVLLYSGLGNSGKVKHFSYVETETLAKENYLLSSRAAKQVMEILTTDDSSGRVFSVKTGTSYGHRDALAIGFDKQYVVGIWIGSPNGSPMREATGASLAVPLLHKIYQVLPESKTPFLFANNGEAQTIAFKNLSQSRSIEQESLNLQFPIDKTVIPLEKEGIPCSIRGGAKPYHWLVNGKPVHQSWQQRYLWKPDKSGFYTFTVIDAQGQSVKANIEIC
jgi:penicillin-binding protein 1C